VAPGPIASDLQPLIDHPHNVLEPVGGPLLNVVEVEHAALWRRRPEIPDGWLTRMLRLGDALMMFLSHGGLFALKIFLTSLLAHLRSPGPSDFPAEKLLRIILSLQSGFVPPSGREARTCRAVLGRPSSLHGPSGTAKGCVSPSLLGAR